MGTIIFYPVTLTLEFDLFSENFNFANNFWIVSARALLFHMSIPCNKTFPWVPFFLSCDLTLEFDPFLKPLNLLITFEQWLLELWYFTWVSFVIRPFRGYHLFFTLWTWPESLTYFLKTYPANIFWKVSARALIFHTNIPCDEIFL